MNTLRIGDVLSLKAKVFQGQKVMNMLDFNFFAEFILKDIIIIIILVKFHKGHFRFLKRFL